MGDERERARDAAREWVRATTGILSAFKEAIDETIDEMRERGDLAPERAKEAVRKTMRKAQEAVGETRERLDFVPRREFEALQEEVAELRRRLSELEGRAGGEDTAEIPVDSELEGRCLPIPHLYPNSLEKNSSSEADLDPTSKRSGSRGLYPSSPIHKGPAPSPGSYRVSPHVGLTTISISDSRAIPPSASLSGGGPS